MNSVLVKATREWLNQWGRRVPVQLRQSALESDAQLIGAIHMALETASHTAANC
jgi:hypothetical protein